jgi:MFS transporter, DHA1 family, tetracycline resistance protein
MKTKERKYPQLVPLWMGVFSDIIGFSLLITVYPSIALAWNLTPLQAGFVMAINGLFSFLSAPIWGRMSDKFGRKPMLLISQFGTFLGFMILAFSPNFTWVIISRVVDGIFGGNFPISKAIINDIVKPKDLAREMTTIGVAHNFANLFGPAVGGILFKYTGLIGPGLAAAATSIVTFAVTWVMLKESAPAKVGILPQSIYQLSSDNNVKPPIDSDEHPKWYKNKPLVGSLFILGFSSLGFMTLVSNFSMFGLLKFSLDSQSMGIFLAFSAILQIIIRYTVYMPALRKFGVFDMVIVGFGLYLIEFTLLAFIEKIWHFAFILLLSTVATSSTRGGVNSFIGTFAAPHERGKVQGIATSLDTFAQILGPIMGGTVLTYLDLEYFGSVSFIFMLISLILLLSSKVIKRSLAEKHKELPSQGKDNPKSGISPKA